MPDCFGTKILNYKQNILHDIQEIVAIPSVADVDAPQKPLGKGSAEALGWILNRAGELGLATVNAGDFAGHAEYGRGGEIAAVVTHVDVVPAGGRWTGNPFKAEERNGKLYGRGVADDKGAAVVALYCLKALMDEGVATKRRARAIFGAGEEIASGDLEYYFEREELPLMAFTPDTEYGVCNREKGILHLEVSAAPVRGVLTGFASGTVVNAVPEEAAAVVSCTKDEERRLIRLAGEIEGGFRFENTKQGLTITSVGRAAHAMEPQKGVNAAARLLRLLSACFGYRSLGKLCAFLDGSLGLELDGRSLGIRQEDEASGPLTVNLGVVVIGGGESKALLDIRYPVTGDGGGILRKLQKAAQENGVTLRVLEDKKPLYVPEDAPLIAVLKQAYRTVTGGEADVYGTGGGTYARKLQGRGVAFGPFFKGEENHLHDADECIDIEKFMVHAQICLQALYQMVTE